MLALPIEERGGEALANLQGKGALEPMPSPWPRLGRAEERGDALGCPERKVVQVVVEHSAGVTTGMATVAAIPTIEGKA